MTQVFLNSCISIRPCVLPNHSLMFSVNHKQEGLCEACIRAQENGQRYSSIRDSSKRPRQLHVIHCGAQKAYLEMG